MTKNKIQHQKHIEVLFLTYLVLLEKSSQEDFSNTLKDKKI